ncbi:MAG: cation-efflux pump [Beijerinckiaceae bacterium]|nr:cation-efflux pump [Beijerinckiaceae bacterium]
MNDLQKLKSRAALASIVASAGLTLGKFVAAILSGSLALMSEALHGLLDVGATMLTYFAIRAADKPADDEHHYGHAKIEAVAALIETGLLILLSMAVLFEAVRRIIAANPPEVDATWLTFGVLIVSIVVDVIRWRSLDKVAKQTKSDALAADALHFSSDLVASSLVLVGLVATVYGFKDADALAAVGVSIFVGIAGYRLGRRTIDTLVDKAPDGIAEDMRAIAENVSGVGEVEELRLRRAGPAILGEISVAVSRTLPSDRIMAIKAEIARAITENHPDAALTVTANLRVLSDETVLERVLMAAARRRLPIHHITIQDVNGVKSIGVDLELDARMSHGDAHDIASALETAIRDELGAEVEVDTHIEPMEIEELAGRDADASVTGRITDALVRLAREENRVVDVHDVRVRETPSGLVVNYHCRVEPDRTVAQVHLDVDRIDRRLQAEMSGLVRVIGHAEPLRG